MPTPAAPRQPEGGRAGTPPASAPLPDRIGPCRILSLLGSGGTGSVYLGELVEARPYGAAGDRVAVKRLEPLLLGGAEALQRFAREARIGQAIVSPELVRTLEGGVDARGAHFLVLEYVAGKTLAELMAELGTVPEPL